jgi:hypothetical protein
VDVDPRFRDQFAQVLGKFDLMNFDKLMEYDGYFDELPLYGPYADVSFLNDLPARERDRILIRAAVAHLETILDYSRRYYAGRDYDFFCAVTVTNWEFAEKEGSPIKPQFWFANPSRGVFEYVKLDPPTSVESRFVADCLDHSPDYALNDDIDRRFEPRLERVWVQHVSCLAPINQGGDEG